ncbi:hypothetical protein [Halodurantibacterium flavum]|uniref:Uncharacterized protein n=1 Tax=Halodurantibacterium flavum TaxID=1382802 RepID=A0ABW4S2S7_9RHOB
MRIEDVLGWAKTIGGMAQTACRGLDRVRGRVIPTMISDYLVWILVCWLRAWSRMTMTSS